MKRLLMGIAAAAAAGAAFTTIAAPYEDYQIQIRRAQEAKLNAAEARAGAMPQHMSLMQEMSRQLDEARGVDRMSPEQMRSWITRHTELMDRMHQQMQGGEMPMMGGHGMSRPAR